MQRRSVVAVWLALATSWAFRVGPLRTRRRTRCQAVAAEEDFEVGSSVRVVAEDITLWHHPKSKQGLNPNGLVGKVTRVATVPRDGSATPISANYELCVMFSDPKLLAHFTPTELELVDDDTAS
eukprot:CAMPEP_0198660500 /NCGR_PEP_ID=MMETSP1467-20131203/37154_1 /TAXON_ID=1462469 /ORGANISM="unid. sp., Strain CCMP2135" /LENGTH=123 /DNA_ID=CAMNT_0044396903 /DNA_START=1 /DNA_END=372 /DNA_ORIENTATION=+